jgi:serine/threonine protein kinase
VKDYLVDDPQKGMTTLVEALRRKRNMRISIDPTLCALLTCLDISEALKFMHKAKTLHGDLKPHNILLVSAPQVPVPCFVACLGACFGACLGACLVALCRSLLRSTCAPM